LNRGIEIVAIKTVTGQQKTIISPISLFLYQKTRMAGLRIQ